MALWIEWNPLPFLGAAMAAGAVYYWGPEALDRVKGRYLPVQMTPLEYAEEYFCASDKGDPITSMRYIPVEHYTRKALQRKTKESDKFVYFDAFLTGLRPYFVPVKESDKKWSFNNVPPLDLPTWMRLALLPDFADLNTGGNRLWRLMPHLCTLTDVYGEGAYFISPQEIYVFQPLYQSPDVAAWERAYPRIKYLFRDQPFNFTTNPHTGCVELHVWNGQGEEGKFYSHPDAQPGKEEDVFIPVVPLPYEPLPFVEAAYPAGHLQDGWLYFGEQFLDRHQPGHWLKIDDLTHFLVMGTSGFGKSVFLNQILQGVRHNLHRFDQVVLIDLKGGVELWPYTDFGEQFRVVYQLSALPEALAGLVTMIEERLETMRQARQRTWPGKKTFLVVDEYAQIQLQPEDTKEERAAKRETLANLNKISMLGRAAGVLIWAQLQKGTTDVMDSSFRANLASQVCFKVPNKLTAAGMFGSTDELLVDPVKLLKGRFVLFDAGKGETYYLQARVVKQ